MYNSGGRNDTQRTHIIRPNAEEDSEWAAADRAGQFYGLPTQTGRFNFGKILFEWTK